MRFFIFCFLIFSTCYAFDFDCLKGPKFWCATYANAKKCGKITECFMNNKNQKKINETSCTSINGEFCNICMKFVQMTEAKIPKLTEQQFVNLVNSIICDQIKGESQSMCKNFVTEFGPLVYQAIKTEATPEKICGLVQVCKNNKEISLIKIFERLEISADGLCSKCKEIFHVIEAMFTKVTPDEFKFLVETLVCMQLPTEFQSTCKALIDGYASQLYNLIASLLDGDRICPLIHFCSSNSTRKFDIWNCQTCLDVVQVLRKDVVNIPASDIESFIKSNMCSKLNLLVKGICNDYVNSLVPQFMNDIHSSLTPQQICNKKHLCMIPSYTKPVGPTECDLCENGVSGVNSFISNADNINKMKAFVKIKFCTHLKSMNSECSNLVDKYGDMTMIMVTNHMNSKTICKSLNACTWFTAIRSNPIQNIKSIECDACHLAVKKIKEFVSDPTKETFIKNFLKDKVCPIFKSEKIQCQQLVNEYFNIILNFILSELDVDKVCKSMGMCATKLTSNECDVCENVMDEVVRLVTSNYSEEVVSKFITTEICPRLGFVKTECTNYINTYLPIIFSIAQSTLNSKVLCAELNLCRLISQKKINFVMKNKSNKLVKCESCLFIVNEVKQLLTNLNIQKTIENFMKNEICSHFESKKQECINYIKQYYTLVVNIIVAFLNPALCNELRLCNTTNIPMITRQSFIEIRKPGKIPQCRLCSKFYNYIHSISSKIPNTDIVIGLVALCNQIDGHEKSKCLEQYRNFDAIIEAYNQSENIAEFCKMTKLCTRQRKYVLGAKPCTWGPGFWCISRRHALACGPGAVKHCEMKVWNQKPTL